MSKKKKKGEKNIISTVIKGGLFVIVLTLQILAFIVMYTGSKLFSNYFNIGFEIIRIIAMITVLYNHDKLEYKLAWILFMGVLPIAGIVIYLIWGRTKPNKQMRNARDKSIERGHKYFVYDDKIENELKKQDDSVYRQVEYLKNVTGYPIYSNQGIEYFKIGEEYFESLIDDLKSANSYILLEYFIISKGNLWNKIEKILRQKVAQGVVIKIIVDEWGTMLKRPKEFFNEAKELGIEIVRYNPIRYGINNYINYRNHRKIVVIDGNIAYTGGVNIADEYVNTHRRFGYWKDNGVRVKGKIVMSYMISFLKTFEIASKKEVDYNWFVEKSSPNNVEAQNGYLIFYSDGPDNRKNPAERAYINLINQANKYLYIYTPYLALSREIMEALLTSSRSGVDIRLITPYKPDKKYMHILTRSYYQILLESGIKIYEYLPGFLHGKTFLSDDKVSIIGTINLDYRSLNLNYECAMLTFNTGVEAKIKEDFEETIDVSEEIKLEDIKKRNIFTRILEAILTAVSPML